jgi:3-phosphoshikimate 1-carboxyvinyltransferase
VTSLTVEPAVRGLRGRLRVPGDKSISHRALLLAARADGRSEITGLSAGEDVIHTGTAIRAFGAGVERGSDRTVVVDGATPGPGSGCWPAGHPAFPASPSCRATTPSPAGRWAGWPTRCG